MSRPRSPEQRRRQKGSDARLAHVAARHWARRAWWVVLGIFAGCAVGPDYAPPQISVPQAWHAELGGGAAAEEMDPQALASWWTTLDDPTLTSLIERAVRNNLDLKKAQARVGEARASRGVSQASLFPTLDLTASATRSHSSQNAMGDTQDVYANSIGFDASWELDLFGGVRRSVESAAATLQANTEDLRSVLVSLLAEVALNYIEARMNQARLGIAEANLRTQAETRALAAVRLEAGLTTALDMEQATYSLESTRSQIPTLQTSVEQAKNRLAVLLGEQPGGVHTELARPQPVPVTPLEVAVGVPADVLRRRPDVRQAERKLAAQTAQVGVATAELYPKFSLLGSIGLDALTLTNLFSAASRTYNVGPSITWRIFDAGAIRKKIEVQSALQEQALIQYEATVLAALEEVENALVAYAHEQRRREALREATQAAQRAVELAQSQYSAGLVDFRSVLEAERSLLSFQDQLAQSDGAATSNLVRLYKTLGGGWTPLVSAATGSTGAPGEPG